jgi:hypothetical protein
MASKVVGKRVTGESPGWTLYIVAAVLVVLSVRSFVAHDPAWGGVYAFAAVVVALIGRTLRGDTKRTAEILSACPVCGAPRQRGFMVVRDERNPYTSCGACIAYLRLDLDSLEVSEEASDANAIYVVNAAQYVNVVPRTNVGFKFQMPTICAVCGAAEAPHLRKLAPVSRPNAGVIGAVASGVASEVAFDAGFAQANRNYNSNTLSSGAELDLQLREVETHVCDKHTAITERGVEYSDGDLLFALYRHYKAFCELNHISAPRGAEDAGPPQARLVAS